MSHWPHAGPGTPGNPPPLPPRNDGQGLVPTPDAGPRPALPPRPGTGMQWGYVPVSGAQRPPSYNQTGQPVSPGQPTTPQNGGHHQYQPTNPNVSGYQAAGYSDISHLFPGGKIPPPPPMRPHSRADSNPQNPSSTGSPNINVVPSAYEPTVTSPPVPNVQSSHVQGVAQPTTSTQNAFPPRDSWQQPVDSTGHTAPNTNAYNPNHTPSRESHVPKEATQPDVRDDVAAINENLRTMRLENPNGTTPSYSSSQPSTNSGPSIPKHVPPPSQQSPTPQPHPRDIPKTSPPQKSPYTPSPAANPSNATPTTPPTQSGKPERECISSNVTFAATWHTHPRAPDFPICESCYDNEIRHSPSFASAFKTTYHDDGKPHACGWKSPRIKDCLWKPAVSSGNFDRVVEYLALRSAIPDCVGLAGAKGDSGIKWYRPRNNAIPAMVVCQACYEDLILSRPSFGIEYFEPSTLMHAADQTWTCDMAMPYIQREFKVRAQMNDWQTFVSAVPARMGLKACPGDKTVYPSNKFFTPVQGPQGLLICMACFCDFVLLTDQADDWKDAGDDLATRFGVSVSCFFGAQFNMRVLAGRTLESNDQALFKRAMDIVVNSPRCAPQMQSTMWFTLLSDPPNFEICRACLASIVVPMGIEHHFTLKRGESVSAERKVTCSFNPGIARFGMYMIKLLEMVFKQDPRPLEDFVKEYACLPLCSRDRYVEKRSWYGWKECTICAECYHEFIRGTALAPAMPHQGTFEESGVMCEMYSGRMRQLYLAACASEPADATPLLEYSLQRRAVYGATMPRARQINADLQIKIHQQNMALNNSMFYNFTGNTFYRTTPIERTYAGSAIGAGYHNHLHVKGAEYARQAAAIGAEIRGSQAHVADELVRQWRAVE